MTELALPDIPLAISEEDVAAVWRCLTRYDALDLAEMLGLFE